MNWSLLSQSQQGKAQSSAVGSQPRGKGDPAIIKILLSDKSFAFKFQNGHPTKVNKSPNVSSPQVFQGQKWVILQLDIIIIKFPTPPPRSQGKPLIPKLSFLFSFSVRINVILKEKKKKAVLMKHVPVKVVLLQNFSDSEIGCCPFIFQLIKC